ncbi:unnamed protein product [Litomosoides sigmodontis]|uniref:Uncharacterized protein n=1 Tax=Litomosoides sigmodontis TaxID=42156 RepID=A0A3P6T8V8_LITSI|nr:unnamed protein product [Litomosoides sigmodontis]
MNCVPRIDLTGTKLIHPQHFWERRIEGSVAAILKNNVIIQRRYLPAKLQRWGKKWGEKVDLYGVANCRSNQKSANLIPKFSIFGIYIYWSKDLVLREEMLHCWITSIFFILGFISVTANCNLQSDRFDRQDRDYRPLQFGKRDGYRPLQFGKKSFRPLQFGKRDMGEAPDYFY